MALIRQNNPRFARGSTKEARALLRRDGAAEQPSLGAVAAVRDEERPLLLGLDSFGHHPKLERPGHREHGGHDRRVVGIRRDVPDEGPVDLERVDW